MSDLFLNVVNRSISASWLVGVVLLLRLLLKRAPKWVNVLLWGIVAVRLICPVSIESTLSLVPSAQTIRPEIMLDWQPQIDTGITALNDVVNPVITESFRPQPSASANPLQIWIPVWSVIWLTGTAALLMYTAVSYIVLRRKVQTAVLLRYNIFQSEYVTTPFVLGIFKPKVYLPFTMSREEIIYVVSHEKAHIRRRDHWWKPLGFLLLTIHWFNPVMWLAYKLFCRDIELACDEAVIRNLGNEQRADYAQALLACSTKPRLVAACPIAFGEVGVKTRIRSVLHYRRPTFWILLCSAIACLVLAVCFLTDPKEPEVQNTVQGNMRTYYEMTDGTWLCGDISYQNRLERRGRLPNAAVDTVYVYLSNVDISFEQAYKATVSSHTKDYFEAEDAVLVEMWTEEATASPTEETAAQEATQKAVNDLAYFMELALPDKDFQYMDGDAVNQILGEYGDLLDGYSLIDRETTDGSLFYIVGHFDGPQEDNPFYQLQGQLQDHEDGRALLLYRERTDRDALEQALAAGETPETGYIIRNSYVHYDYTTGFLLMHPMDTGWQLSEVFNRYQTANGRAYMLDAASRGVALCTPEGSYLEVQLISENWGEISEKIPLTEEQAAQILSEERQKIDEGFGFSAWLSLGPNSAINMEAEAAFFTEFRGIPQTVLDLATEVCGYRFASPKQIQSTIVEARLDGNWLDGPRYAGEEDLTQLETMLKQAEFGYIGSCGYGAKLTIKMADGSEMVLFKGTDGCDTIAFGSYGGYFLGDPENEAFWKMFGVELPIW